MSRDKEFRCTICGQYISYEEIDNGQIVNNFTPDTETTLKSYEMTHASCVEKLKQQEEQQQFEQQKQK